MTNALPVPSNSLVGRDGIIRNMLWRLDSGESLALYSGPSLGKTAILLNLKDCFEQKGIVANYCDLTSDDFNVVLQGATSNQDGQVMLFDNCDVFQGDMELLHDLLHNISHCKIVLAGGYIWHEVILEEKLAQMLRAVPLSVLLDKDARALIGLLGFESQTEEVFNLFGSHPHILRICSEYIFTNNLGIDDAQLFSKITEVLRPFFLRCVKGLSQPIEYELLHYLVQRGVPINPKSVEHDLNKENIKSTVNKLCWLGLISRCIRDDQATLFANCKIFNSWYLEYVSRH